MNSARRLASFAALALLLCGTAKSATVTVTQAVDLDAFLASNASAPYSLGFSGATPVWIDEGDDVQVTFLFSDNKALRFTNSNSSFSTNYDLGWPFLGDQGPAFDRFRISNALTTLINPTFAGGSGDTTYFTASQESQEAHLGPWVYLGLDAGASVTFTGIQASFHVDQLHLPVLYKLDPNDQGYDPNYVPGSGPNQYVPWFHSFSEPWEIVSPGSNSVPDGAATASLLLLGLIGLGSCHQLRRRSN